MFVKASASFLVAILLAGACSDDAETAPEPDPVVSTTTAAPGSSTTLVPPPPTDPPEVPIPTIGELALPCGVVDELALPDGPGVGDDVLTIGTGNDRGGLATFNAGRGLTEAVSALADYCNGLGGLAGREIVVVDYDAAGIETAERVREACDEVIAMVGFRYLEALVANATAAECGLPMVPASLSPAPPVWLHGQFAALFAAPGEAAQVALVGPDTLAAAFERQRRVTVMTQEGSPFSVAIQVAYPLDSQPDWTRLVGEARASGAGAVRIEGGCDHAVIPFLEVAAAAGWDPVVVADASAYDDACLAAGSLVDRLLIELPLLPFEDGEAAPVAVRLGEIFDEIGAPRTGDALLAASAFWRWVVATAACGGAADRACIVREASAIDGWTTGGLHPEVGADGSIEPCAVVMGVRDGEWIRLLPAEPGTYECNPAWAPAGP